MGHRRLSRKATAAFFLLSFRVALAPVMLAGRLGLRAPRSPRRSARRPPRQHQPCGCRASRGAAGAEWRSGRQGRWPLDASSRSPQTPGEQHWPLGYLISPNTPRHGPNSVVDQQLPGHWPRPRAAKQKPSKTPGQNAQQRPGNPQALAFCAGHSAKRQEAGRSGCRAFHFGAGGSAATGRGDGTTGRRRGTCCCS